VISTTNTKSEHSMVVYKIKCDTYN